MEEHHYDTASKLLFANIKTAALAIVLFDSRTNPKVIAWWTFWVVKEESTDKQPQGNVHVQRDEVLWIRDGVGAIGVRPHNTAVERRPSVEVGRWKGDTNAFRKPFNGGVRVEGKARDGGKWSANGGGEDV